MSPINSSFIDVRPCDYADVEKLWRKLWDERYDFKPTSSMLYLSGYDGNIPKIYSPTFLGAYSNKQLVGVFSGHLTTPEHFRGRGLFIEDSARGAGVGSLLITTLLKEAAAQGAKMLWATPREKSLPLFLKLGFTQDSDFTHEGFLFGPNCYVSKKI